MKHPLLLAAQGYVCRLGWPVVPLWPKDKNPLIKEGHLGASLDPEQVTTWWTRWPNANIGVAVEGRMVVVDIDPRSGGDTHWDILSDDRETGAVLSHTGGGGQHLLFKPDGQPWKNVLAPGVEVKTKGYIVAPPSIHPSGQPYAWDFDHHPLDTNLPEAPDWLKALGTIEPTMPRERVSVLGTILGRAFAVAGRIRKELDDWRIAVDCPWEQRHTIRSRTGTVVLGLGKMGWFKCSHSHCDGRTARDALAELPPWASLPWLGEVRP